MTWKRTCPWCHALNNTYPERASYCRCGHRADLPRGQCDCGSCRPATLPLPPPEARPRLLPFLPTRRHLSLALFYECELPTEGKGTLSEAEAEATLMLAAPKLYDACQALVALIDREKRTRMFDAELIAVADMARAALEAAEFTPA